MRNIRQKLPLRSRSRRLIRALLRLQALEHHHAAGHMVVLRQVDPPHAAVRDDTLDLVLACHHVTALQLRRRNALLHHRLGGVLQLLFRLGRSNPRQLHHAVRHRPRLTLRPAQLLELLQRLTPRAFRRTRLQLRHLLRRQPRQRAGGASCAGSAACAVCAVLSRLSELSELSEFRGSGLRRLCRLSRLCRFRAVAQGVEVFEEVGDVTGAVVKRIGVEVFFFIREGVEEDGFGCFVALGLLVAAEMLRDLVDVPVRHPRAVGGARISVSHCSPPGRQAAARCVARCAGQASA